VAAVDLTGAAVRLASHADLVGSDRLRHSTWLLDNGDLITLRSRALDIACGNGRHALLLASAGIEVHAVDRDAQKIADVRALAVCLDLPVVADVMDLESPAPPPLEANRYELVLVVHYLHRPLFPALIRSLAPRGILIYETFTLLQSKRGKPTNPDFLLKPRELETLTAPLQVVRRREGEFDGRMVSAIVARKT
jgi:tellurite methyltransferase